MKDDKQYYTTTINKVDGADGQYSLTFEDGWSFHVPECPFTPKVGDEVKIYGKGWGYIVRGLVIDGKTVFYRTEEEQNKIDTERTLQRNKAKKDAYEESSEERSQRIEAMPEPFKERLEGFERRNDEWFQYAEYEMFACEQAIIIADSVKTIEGMEAFRDMSYQEQMDSVEGLSEDHSGNTFGMACLLAYAYLSSPELVPKMHGAMCPLVGCEEYRCYSMENKESEGA